MDVPAVKTLFEKISLRNSQMPPADTCQLIIANEICGTLMRRSREFLEKPDFRDAFTFTKDSVTLNVQNQEEADALLDDLASRLYAVGAFPFWRNELLDVTAIKSGRVVARAERGLFRFLGLTTHCVYNIGSTASGDILMSLRSRTKEIDPGLWDTLAAGLIGAGETPEQALVRETLEEAGLTPDQYDVSPYIKAMVTRRVSDGWMREICYCSPVTLHEEATPTNLDGEVERIEAVSGNEVIRRIREGLVPPESCVAFLTAICHKIQPL